jgi:hypothetical protein
MRINLSAYGTGEDFLFTVGEIYDVLFEDNGVKFLINGVYTLPYSTSTFKTFFKATYVDKIERMSPDELGEKFSKSIKILNQNFTRNWK